MKIELYEGCTSYGASFDGVHVTDDNFDHSKVLDELLVKVREWVDDGSIGLLDIVKLFQYDRCDYDATPCDQCGDTTSVTYYDL